MSPIRCNRKSLKPAVAKSHRIARPSRNDKLLRPTELNRFITATDCACSGAPPTPTEKS
jgi:hypothetical protein